MKRWPLVVGALAAIALVLGIALHTLAVDDAFITYRYAHNLATGHGFTYNPGHPVLSTTAPLWALALAAGALLWPDIPALANSLSAIALGIGAVLLFLLGRRERMPWVGALAALFYVLYPLLWLSLGLETAVFLALALGRLLAYRGGRLHLTAVLLALATLTRADGLVLAAVLAAERGLVILSASAVGTKNLTLARKLPRRNRDSSLPAVAQNDTIPRIIGAAALYVAVMLPLLAWLTWQFGSPLPVTLAAKRAQAELGITGFYAHTTYLEGLGILLRARLAQSEKYLLFIPAVVVRAGRHVEAGALGAPARRLGRGPPAGLHPPGGDALLLVLCAAGAGAGRRGGLGRRRERALVGAKESGRTGRLGDWAWPGPD